jgi:hypothetical protein
VASCYCSRVQSELCTDKQLHVKSNRSERSAQCVTKTEAILGLEHKCERVTVQAGSGQIDQD